MIFRGILKMFNLASGKQIKTTLLGVALAAAAIAPAQCQSLKIESPSPLKEGVNRGVIDSFGTEQYWSFMATGKFQLSFSRSGAQEGFNVARCGVGAVFAPKTAGSKMTFVESPSGTVFTGDVNQPTRVVIMIEPAKSMLVRQTNEYTLNATGSVNYAGASSSDSAASVVGTYAVDSNGWGAAKFTQDGNIITTSGSNGTWQLFDADTRTYVVIIAGQRLTLTFEPGRGLVDNNNQLMFKSKR
jgi:hypothetical protein